jgi:hypothetical protein
VPWLQTHFELVLATFGVVLAVIGIAATIWVARRERRPKTLDWEMLANLPIVGRGATSMNGSKLEVVWDKTRPLTQPQLVKLRILNTGRREIEGDEYTEPVSVAVQGEIIEATVTDTSPANVYPLGTVKLASKREVQLSPKLLNPEDWIDLQLLVDGEKAHPRVKARFAGQNRAMTDWGKFKRRRFKRRMFTAIILATIPVIFATIYTATALTRPPGAHDFGLFVLMLSCVPLFAVMGIGSARVGRWTAITQESGSH